MKARMKNKLTPCSTGDVNQPNSAPDDTISNSTSVTITGEKIYILNIFVRIDKLFKKLQ